MSKCRGRRDLRQASGGSGSSWEASVPPIYGPRFSSRRGDGTAAGARVGEFLCPLWTEACPRSSGSALHQPLTLPAGSFSSQSPEDFEIQFGSGQQIAAPRVDPLLLFVEGQEGAPRCCELQLSPSELEMASESAHPVESWAAQAVAVDHDAMLWPSARLLLSGEQLPTVVDREECHTSPGPDATTSPGLEVCRSLELGFDAVSAEDTLPVQDSGRSPMNSAAIVEGWERRVSQGRRECTLTMSSFLNGVHAWRPKANTVNLNPRLRPGRF